MSKLFTQNIVRANEMADIKEMGRLLEENQQLKNLETASQLEIERLQAQIVEVKNAYRDADRLSSLRGWAVDRAIRVAEVNKSTTGVTNFVQLKEMADSLVNYCHITEAGNESH